MTQVLLEDGDSDELSKIQDGVLYAIERGLDTLGNNVREVFYSDMELAFNLTRNEIVRRPEDFAEAISRFFDVGSSVVERTIGREIVKTFGIPVCPGLTFRVALEIVRRHPRPVKAHLARIDEEIERAVLIRAHRYDPTYCKTCQRLGKPIPIQARVPFSDCQEHFAKRVAKLRKTVRIAGNVQINPLFSVP